MRFFCWCSTLRYFPTFTNCNWKTEQEAVSNNDPVTTDKPQTKHVLLEVNYTRKSPYKSWGLWIFLSFSNTASGKKGYCWVFFSCYCLFFTITNKIKLTSIVFGRWNNLQRQKYRKKTKKISAHKTEIICMARYNSGQMTKCFCVLSELISLKHLTNR